MEKTLKELPEYMRLTEDEKAKFEGMFKAFKGLKKEFVTTCLKKVVDEVIKGHESDTDSENDDDVEILKSIKI